MKKILLIFLTLSFLANADYAIFKSQTKDLTNITKVKVIYFGDYNDFSKILLKEGSKDGFYRSLFGGIKDGLSGGGMGLIVGFLNPFVLNSKMDKKYLQVERIEDADGNVAFRKIMFIGAKGGKEYSEDEIKKIIKESEDA